MAFCNKIGSLLRHSIFQTGSASSASMLNSVRCISTKLVVSGLSSGTDDASLKEAFSSFGDVTEATVVMDCDTGRSAGFGFVDFASKESCGSALFNMDGQELQGRTIRVNFISNGSVYGGPIDY